MITHFGKTWKPEITAGLTHVSKCAAVFTLILVKLFHLCFNSIIANLFLKLKNGPEEIFVPKWRLKARANYIRFDRMCACHEPHFGTNFIGL